MIPLPIALFWSAVFIIFGYMAIVLNLEWYRAKWARAINGVPQHGKA